MSIVALLTAYPLTSFLLVVHHGEGLQINNFGSLMLAKVGKLLRQDAIGG